MEIKGKVYQVGQTETVGNNGFTKRLLVIETQEQYSQKVPVDYVKEKTSLLDGLSIGQEVTASVNVRGNEYNGKFYVSLQGWKLDKGQSAPVQQSQTSASSTFIPEDDNMPF